MITLADLQAAWQFCQVNPESTGGRKHYEQCRFEADEATLAEFDAWVEGM